MTVLPARAAYQILAKDYDALPNPLIALEQRTVSPLLPELVGCTMLDVAAGTGRWAKICAARGARAVAIDFCPEMLLAASRESVIADANLLPLRDACADVTVCSFALGYAPGCLAELCRVTRSGGIVLVSDVHPDAIRRGWTRSFRAGGDVIHVEHARYSRKDLQVPGLELSSLLEPCLDLPEREIFEVAGRLDRFEAASRQPAIFVARWIRT